MNLSPSTSLMIHRPAFWRVFALAVIVVSAFVRVSAASSTGVEVLWDKFGVPHVYAPDLEGVFFGYGYAQMQSHGDLVLKLYGESRGRAAEYFGEKSADPVILGGTDNLENDRWVQLNEAPERAVQWFEAQTADYKKYLTAFAAGMNAYAERHGDKLAPDRKRVLPITPVDPLLHVHRIVNFAYLSSMSQVKAAAKAALGQGSGAAAVGSGESNAWAIAPARTANGKTLMLMNPHLPWADWYTYYEAQLNAPGVSLYGSSQIGFPMLRFVFSDILGFTQTVNSIDASDLYQLTLSADGKSYLFDGTPHPFESREKTLKIRQPDGTLREERLLLRKSIHGPVVWDEGGLTLAIRTAGLDRPYGIEQYWKMAMAHSFAEYQAQVARLQVPTFNITYADRAGHIMYLYNGTLPKRATGDRKFWAGIVPGDTSATLWTDIHPYKDLPKVIDPPTGWVQNTNNPPWSTTFPATLDPKDYPSYVAETSLSFRAMTSLRMLHEDPALTWENFIANKHSTHLELADRVLDELVAAAEAHGTPLAKQAAKVLQAWDRRAESDSRGALLFEAFALKLLGPALANRSGFAVAEDWHQPFTTPRGLKDPAKAAAQLDEAAAETLKRYGSLDAPWGEFRRFALGQTDLPGNGADGNLGAFRVMRYSPATKGAAAQRAVFGDTFFALVEFGDPLRAQVLTSYGNSSQPGSTHHDDQLPLLAAKQTRPALLKRAEVEANLESIDRF